MSVVYMTEITISNYKLGQEDNEGYEYDTDDLSSPGNGDSIIIPDNIREIECTLYIGTNSVGKIQTTTNKVADVIADNNVIWVDWSNGNIHTTIQDYCKPVTAMRMVNILGTTRLMIKTV